MKLLLATNRSLLVAKNYSLLVEKIACCKKLLVTCCRNCWLLVAEIAGYLLQELLLSEKSRATRYEDPLQDCLFKGKKVR